MRTRSAWAVLLSVLLAAAFAGGSADAQRRPRILLTDDDGISAPGLLALYPELARLGEVTVAAPADNQSGVGHGITYAEPIAVREIEPLVKVEGPQGKWYRIVARPATCVRLALSTLLGERPDLVVSGINRGDNVGLVVYVSGTVGAAREAAFDGLPSIAASQAIGPGTDYKPGAAFVGRLAAEVLRRGLPRGTFLNVNFPAGGIKGVKVVPHAMTAGVNTYEKRVSPRGETYFWNVWEEPSAPGLDTDVGAVRNGYIAVTPLSVDVNAAAAARTELEGWNLK
ncbi:MAG TPA: 5'/3'-nucleotidase SurE [Vicinamibacteria bacterium]|nr:5'/3'-nucleotidase SurE [Vicinamibacteria bacterium]